jgi:D-glycero-alpha-D-manno-heptose 1-phosphate guanylyltransferase
LSDITAVLLAGGQGTRIRELYPDVPKPMVPVAGKPFLHWVTAYIARHGVRSFVYSTGYKGEQIEKWCADGSMPGLTRQVCQEHEPLGTAGGLMNCLERCGSWILVANGDSLCLGGTGEILSLQTRDGIAGGIVGVLRDDTSRYGSLDIDDAGRLRAFREKVPGRGYVNAGVYLFSRSALMPLRSDRPSSIERDLIPGLLDDGAIIQSVMLPDTPFIDIGTPETVAEADSFIRTHEAQFSWPA